MIGYLNEVHLLAHYSSCAAVGPGTPFPRLRTKDGRYIYQFTKTTDGYEGYVANNKKRSFWDRSGRHNKPGCCLRIVNEHASRNKPVEAVPAVKPVAMTQAAVTPAQKKTVSGIEARVCIDIANRQALGVAKYGTTVADNPLHLRQWLQHAYEEALDMAVYLRRAIDELARNQDTFAGEHAVYITAPTP